MSKTGLKVALIGADGNVFNLLGICRRALLRGGKMDLWDEFFKEATSGDYYHALAIMSEYFDIVSVNDGD